METAKETLDSLEAAILVVLMDHRGKEAAISREKLVAGVNALLETQINERATRRKIKHLVERHGKWIGSCHGGYFMIETEQEFNAVYGYYRNFGLSIFHVAAKLKKTSLPELMGQLSLELNGGQNHEPV